MALWDDDLEVFIPGKDPLGEGDSCYQWEWVYGPDDWEGRGKPIGVMLEAHPWARYNNR